MLIKLWEIINIYNNEVAEENQLDYYDVLDTINDSEDPEEIEICIREIQEKIQR